MSGIITVIWNLNLLLQLAPPPKQVNKLHVIAADKIVHMKQPIARTP